MSEEIGTGVGTEAEKVVGHEEPEVRAEAPKDFKAVQAEARSEASETLSLGEQSKLLKSLVNFAHSIDSKIDTLVATLEGSEVINEGAFDTALDAKRGIRLLNEDEFIKDEDVAWVSYTARIGGRLISEEEDFPIRIGSGSVLFEESLIGKKAHQGGLTYQSKFKDKSFPKLFGKDIQFSIDIGKVKTKIEGGAVGHGIN